jgi:hypothetical protein
MEAAMAKKVIQVRSATTVQAASSAAAPTAADAEAFLAGA